MRFYQVTSAGYTCSVGMPCRILSSTPSVLAPRPRSVPPRRPDTCTPGSELRQYQWESQESVRAPLSPRSVQCQFSAPALPPCSAKVRHLLSVFVRIRIMCFSAIKIKPFTSISSERWIICSFLIFLRINRRWWNYELHISRLLLTTFNQLF